MQAPLAKMPEQWGDVGLAVKVELTDVITSWLGSVKERMIKGDLLASSLSSLMDGVSFAKMEKSVGVRDLGRKQLICTIAQ